MYNYLIKPIDLFILGNPSPFNSAEQTYRASEKIINPIPFFGALRKKFKDAQINFISLISKNKFLFPLPFDIVKTDTDYKQGILKRTASSKFVSDSEDEYWVSFGEEKIHREFDRYIDSYFMDKYLLSEFEVENIKTSEPIKTEKRIGIKIDRQKRTTEEGFLYFEEYLRFKEDSAFYIKTNFKASEKTIKLGGESRMAILEEIEIAIEDEFVNIDRIQEHIINNGLFKLILLTPTNGPCEISGARMIAKVVERPYVYSGWLRKDKDAFPSRLFNLIKPGAVFYYRIENSNREEFVKSLFNRFWLKPAFFKPDFPYFESLDGINPLCLGLTIIGTVKEVSYE
ncbi:type III-B CRISPR module-associated Cmr3 family protein [Thermodesulfobacterium thermophilum]|uniref:type III-B CRISPR module-associated Cmr3 family protein n=1 Tax=Thermodesulfobacterium thermophilum TaxID=886 RepID=UPI0003B48B24|nr:type III-B CRISPR module-associated Cmr3 family protein [Thermodesulfobacterium thermophilum]